MARGFAGLFKTIAVGAICLVTTASVSFSASRESVEAFLKTTGFDVAIDSIALSAAGAPSMLGLEEAEFGSEWARAADLVFSEEIMRDRAITILEATLDDDVLAHAAGFYASDLGMRLVEAENIAHFADDEVKQTEGQEILEELMSDNHERVMAFERMGQAIDPNDIGPKAFQEVQIRFVLAAAYAGIIQLRTDEDGLRAAVAEDYESLRDLINESALVANAWTYRDFSDKDVLIYAEALEHPDMATVYELMNAVHYEVMMNRFEALALMLGQLGPAQEL
ncbi:hypothetical protein PH7735_01795 [Shimia thalassica]|uniref:DUF2059 domain-containing protein n=1 Tax=Shimia thalassica TaxID=1715693 RepID=A0A0P1I7A9_9RHOB|nr:DUF2059 domain-containing protein [Shimia thalassica]CUJ94842.1 hypothetical protein PH7735_01795 [Shimia thalassica]